MEKNILRLLTFLFCLFLFGVLLIYSFYPTMYVDESLYVGAAVQFLKGDVFLSEYWFDKPIFMGLISVPGILFFGKNILGFSFSGIIASLFSFVYFKDIFGKNFSWVGFLLAAIFFTNPFHLSYLPSAMAEPFLLLALILCMKNLFQFGQTNELKFRNRMFIWFAIAIGFKQSPVMFIPMVFGVFLIKEKSIKYFTRQLVDFFNHTKYIWIVFIFYQATNQTKFAAITWFSKLTDQKIKYSFFEHLVFWSKGVFLTQRFSYLGVLFLFLFGVYTIQILKKIKDEKLPLLKFEKISFEDPRADLVIFIIPLLLHFIGISLSNVKHTDRYLFIFNIQFLVVLFRFISIQKLNKKRVIGGFLLIGLLGNLWTMFDKREELDENIFKGKALLYADSIIPEGSIVHGRLKWHIYPYFKDFFLNSCAKDSCLERLSRGKPNHLDQYVLDSEKPNYIYKYIPKESSKQIIEQNLDILIWEELRKNLRLSSKAKIIKLEKIKDIKETKKFNLFEDSQVWEVVFQDNNSVLSLVISPIVSKGQSHKKMATKEHLMFSFLIHQANLDLKVFDFDALSLFHIIYDGLIIPIEFLDTVNDSNKRFEYLEILSDQKIRFTEII